LATLKRPKNRKPANAASVIGMAGTFHVAAELSWRGLNVLPTVRNTRGFDLIVATQDGRRMSTIQVKASSKRYNFWLLGKIPTGAPKTAFYAFVRRGKNTQDLETFLVPAAHVIRDSSRSRDHSWDSWYLPEDGGIKYLDRWDLIPGASPKRL
jgi:hypothetical protein